MSKFQLCLDQGPVSITGDFRPITGAPAADDYPLVVAIHGGTYTSKYFDIEGYSLMARASSLGIPIFALNRPCYADSGQLKPEEATILRSAEVINEALHQLWSTHAGNAAGIVVIGHSIGGAATILLASMQKKWPLLGIAVSGVGLASPKHVAEQWSNLPPIPSIPLPNDVKDHLMFGPEWTYRAGVPEICHQADFLTPRQELLDIVFEWPNLFAKVASKVTVPVHYRQSEFDPLWVVDESQVLGFKNMFTNAPFVDAEYFKSSGHCIDFHRLGAAFQLQQLEFALRCSFTGKP